MPYCYSLILLHFFFTVFDLNEKLETESSYTLHQPLIICYVVFVQ